MPDIDRERVKWALQELENPEIRLTTKASGDRIWDGVPGKVMAVLQRVARAHLNREDFTGQAYREGMEAGQEHARDRFEEGRRAGKMEMEGRYTREQADDVKKIAEAAKLGGYQEGYEAGRESIGKMTQDEEYQLHLNARYAAGIKKGEQDALCGKVSVSTTLFREIQKCFVGLLADMECDPNSKTVFHWIDWLANEMAKIREPEDRP